MNGPSIPLGPGSNGSSFGFPSASSSSVAAASSSAADELYHPSDFPRRDAILSYTSLVLGLADGDDFFLSYILDIFGGKAAATVFLEALQASPMCFYLWPKFGERVAGDGYYVTFSEVVLSVVEAELPVLARSLKMHALPIRHLLRRIVSSSFAGLFRPEEVQKLIALCLVLGADYLVYFCVTMLRAWVQWQGDTLDPSMVELMMLCRLPGGRVASHVEYMRSLERRYGAAVRKFMIARAR